MDEQANDIVAILTETNTKVRRERAAFVAKLRDEEGLSFKEIGQQVNVSPQRAQQLYSLNKFFQRSANSPYANLSTRARNFLNNVAVTKRLPQDWEQHPAQQARLAHALAHMTRGEAFKIRRLGQGTFQEVEDFLREHGLSFEKPFGEALEDEGELETKHLTGGAPPDQAVQMLTQFMNENEWRGEFKIWPKGTYRGPFPEYAKDAEFSMTTSEFLADAFEENWAFVNLFDAFVKGLGFHVEHGSRSSLHFYFDPFIEQAPATPDQPEQMPARPPADLSND